MKRTSFILVIFQLFLLLNLNLVSAQELNEEENKDYVNQGVRFYKKGEYDQAIEKWKRIPKESKYHPKAQKYIKQIEEKISDNDLEQSDTEKKQ